MGTADQVQSEYHRELGNRELQSIAASAASARSIARRSVNSDTSGATETDSEATRAATRSKASVTKIRSGFSGSGWGGPNVCISVISPPATRARIGKPGTGTAKALTRTYRPLTGRQSPDSDNREHFSRADAERPGSTAPATHTPWSSLPART